MPLPTAADRPGVLVVVGTRPEAIKMAPVVAALRRHDEVETRVALTGQHTVLVDQALEVLKLDPHYALGIMTEGQTLYDVAHACLDGLRKVTRDFRPGALLVEGDTTTVCFGALVGFFEDIRVGHVESGLRSGRKRSPFPEEVFRRISDTVADWCFAPTPAAARKLRREFESFEPGQGPAVHVTGNTFVDTLGMIRGMREEPRDGALAQALAAGGRLVYLTAHRRESFGEPIRRVFRAVRALADAREDVTVVYPVHPNKAVEEAAQETLRGHQRIHLTDPLDYLDSILAQRHAALVLTDSGGVQEEAPTLGTPVLVLREVTERPEWVERGAAELVGTDGTRIVERALAFLDAPPTAWRGKTNPYGDGRAGERIADIVVSSLLGRPRRTEDWDGGEGER